MSVISHRKGRAASLLPAAMHAVWRAIGLGIPLHAVLRKLTLRVVRPALLALDDVENRLRPLTHAMEKKFLACGTELEALTRHTGELVAGAEELVRLATGKDDAERIINETMAMLDGPMGYLDRCTVAMKSQVDTLRGCAKSVTQLLEHESMLQATVAPLQATQTMFRVESSRLGEAERQSFTSLTDQIELLHDQVRDSFRSQFQELSGAREILNDVIGRLSGGVKRQREMLAEKRNHIQEALRRLTAEIERNSHREIELTSKSKTVSASVGRIVVALQSQDIVTQRLEHVFEGLEAARAESDRIESLAGAESGVTEAARIRALVEVQCSQLSGIQSEMSQAGQTVNMAASDIGSAIRTLDRECVFLNDFSEVTAAANGTVQVLLDIIDDVKKLVEHAVKLATDSRELIRPVNDVTSRLTGSVELLSHQMNLVALNAQIQAVQIGAGTGLEVLAAHTAGIAAETTSIGASISSALEDLRTRLDAEMQSFFQFLDSGGSQIEYMASEGREHETRLHEIRDRTLRKLHHVGSCVEHLRESSTRVTSQAQLEERDAAALDAVVHQLQSLAEALDQNCPRPDGVPHGDLLDGQYTMETERRTHREAIHRLRQPATAAAVGAGSEPAATGTTAADEGIELF